MVLDIGSLRRGDSYKDIARLMPDAVFRQLKEYVWYSDRQIPVDVKRIKKIIADGEYRGFLPIETLDSSDPKVKIKKFLSRARKYTKANQSIGAPNTSAAFTTDTIQADSTRFFSNIQPTRYMLNATPLRLKFNSGAEIKNDPKK